MLTEIEKDIENYRKLHPNCKYCAHAKFYCPSLRGIPCTGDWWECECSDKTIRFFRKAKLCRYYRVRLKNSH